VQWKERYSKFSKINSDLVYKHKAVKYLLLAIRHRDEFDSIEPSLQIRFLNETAQIMKSLSREKSAQKYNNLAESLRALYANEEDDDEDGDDWRNSGQGSVIF